MRCSLLILAISCSGESLAQRLKEREEEMKQDEIDRKKEKEEVELLRERLVMENHPDPEGLINEVEF